MIESCLVCVFFFFKQKTAYEMRISDWSSDVCSSDLLERRIILEHRERRRGERLGLARKRAGLAHQILGLARDARRVEIGAPREIKIGRASCRERVCQYV